MPLLRRRVRAVLAQAAIRFHCLAELGGERGLDGCFVELLRGAGGPRLLRGARRRPGTLRTVAGHSAPLVEGTPLTRGSRATAARNARASALNCASAMWCGSRPASKIGRAHV